MQWLLNRAPLGASRDVGQTDISSAERYLMNKQSSGCEQRREEEGLNEDFLGFEFEEFL